MIFAGLNGIAAYRMHKPKWAVTPTSGAGAGAHGGRANRRGIEALYLALDINTAVQEYRQVSTLLPPGTLVSYQVTITSIVDFRGGYQSDSWAPGWQDFFCDWRDLWFNRRIEPPSWALADEAILAGAKGILFPSQVSPGGVNLVLYPTQFGPDDRITVYDPAGALPKNQDSWN